MRPNTEPPDQSLAVRLAALAAFVPIFTQPGFVFGTWSDMNKRDDGSFDMPYVRFSEPAERFLAAVGTNSWITFGFDWGAWAGTPDAQQLRSDDRALDTATPDDLARLLTMLVRGDRFGEGTLLGAYDSGLLTRIVRRAAQLLGPGQ